MRKFKRGILVVSLVLVLPTIPLSTAQAISDEVAVQLLERLSELEREVSNLRGENEVLRKELTSVRSIQREGFLAVDERFTNLERKSLPGTQANNAVAANSTNQATANAGTTPTLEAPAVVQSVTPTPGTIVARPTPITVTPEAPTATVTVTQPANEQLAAVTPVTNSEKSEKVDPNSPESYYFYGDQDKNKDAAQDQTANTEASKASLVAENSQQSLPATHQAKAAYNQAYKLLVNNPASAVPAFRAFMTNYPEHELVANAQYWLGEALYAQKDYSGATEEFMRVLKQYKSSPKAPGAALKLGYSFYELRQWDFARRTLEDTVRFFPETNAAKLAKNRLERMATEGR